MQQQINQCDRQIKELGYERSRHQEILQTLRQNQTWQFRYQELNQAKEQLPQLQTRL